MTPLLTAAQEYAQLHGWAVFPVRDKRPLTANGFKDASTNPQVITGWWTQWPDANIGVACGRISGIVVLDVDPRNGGELDRDLTESTRCALTGGGGQHFYFSYPEHPPERWPKLFAPGVDIQADGRYVVAPPSKHQSGKEYAWEFSSPDELAPFPVHRLPARPTSQSPVSDSPILQGQRDNTLASLAGAMRRKGATTPEILAALQATNARCVPPLPIEDLHRIAHSIARYEPQPAPPTQRPEIHITTDEREVTDKAELALVSDLSVYTRAGLLVRVVRDENAPKFLRRPRGAPRIDPMPNAALRERMGAAAEWLKLDRRSGEWISARVPDWAVETLR